MKYVFKSPYHHPFPFPSKDTQSQSFFAFEEGQPVSYPYPVPSKETFPDVAWPKSLCIIGSECKIENSDLDAAKSCALAAKIGCPLFFLLFNDFAVFAECKDVELFETDQTESKDYSNKDLECMVKNFTDLNGYLLPPLVVLGHDEDQSLLRAEGLPSAGWVSNLRIVGKKLLADFADVPSKVAELLKKKAYRLPSVEIYRSFIKDGQNLGPVLRRVALLGADIPKIKGLSDILARYSETSNSIWIMPDQMGEKMKKQKIFIHSCSGSFKEGDKVTSGKASGTIAGVSDSEMSINLDSESEFENGHTITGPDGKATVGMKAEYPYPPYSKKAEELSADMETLKNELLAKDAKLTELQKLAEQQAAQITQITTDRANEKRLSHTQDAIAFCESLKKEGLAPAIIDDLMRPFLMSLNWQTPTKFSENEPEKTSFLKFSEIMSGIVAAHKGDKLFVPLGSLPKNTDEPEVPTGVDPEGQRMDRIINKYAEDHKVSYVEAFKILSGSKQLQ